MAETSDDLWSSPAKCRSVETNTTTHTHTHPPHTHTHTPLHTLVGGTCLASELDFSLPSHTLSSLSPPPLPPPLPPAPPLLRSISLCSFPYTISQYFDFLFLLSRSLLPSLLCSLSLCLSLSYSHLIALHCKH